MQTRTGSIDATSHVDSDALDAAMKAHPVVLDTIERMAATRRKAEGDRDKALKDLAAEKAEHRKTKAKLEVTQDVNEKMMKSIGTLPVAAAAAASTATPTLTDAEVEEIVGKMSAPEKALVMMKAAPAKRFTMDSAAQADGVFRK